MAEVTLRFRYNATTGKRELIIGYESDEGEPAFLHEKNHRELAEQLLGVPLGDDVEGIRVERVRKDGTVIDGEIEREAERQREPAKISQG
jgi:hypothetical protein